MEARQEILEDFRELIKMRFIAAVVILISLGFVRWRGWLVFPFLPFALAPLAEMLLNQPYLWIAKRMSNPGRILRLNLMLDILIITWGLHFVGGMNLFAGLLVYPLVFIYAGLVLYQKKVSYWLANFSFIAYAVMVYLEYTGIIPAIPSLKLEMTGETRLALLFLTWPFFNLIAYFASNLTDKIYKKSRQLLEAQKRFEDITTHTREWMWEVDTTGRYTYSNAAVKQILGYEPEDVIGRYFYDFLLADVRERFKRETVKIFYRKEGLKDFCNSKLHKDGSIVLLETNAIPILNEQEALLGYRGIDTDVTEKRKKAEEKRRIEEMAIKAEAERKRREEEEAAQQAVLNLMEDLQEAKERLEATLRKLQQMQSQLVQAEKLAVAGTLAAGAAHELNNPLAGIIGFAELILDDLQKSKVNNETLNKDIAIILNNANRCKEIAAGMLIYGRRYAFELVPVNVYEVLEEAITLVGYQIDLRKIRIIKEYAQDIADIKANRSQLCRAFINIIRNGSQAMEGEGQLTIRARRAGDYVQISFKDTGKGIPEEEIVRVFDPFYTTRVVGEGIGLGLSVCAGVIRGHNGEISVESEGKGKGATFTVRLPITEPQK